MKKFFAVFMLIGTLLSFNTSTEARDSKNRETSNLYTGSAINNAPVQVRYRYRRSYRPRYIRTYRYYRPRYRVIRIPRVTYRRTYRPYYRYRTYRYVPRYTYRRVYYRRY